MADEMLPARTRSELTLEAMTAIASAIPYAGGPISTILSGIASDRKMRRVREALEGMSKDLRGFRSTVTEQYVRTDAFADILEQTLRRIADESNAEKRRVYRGLLVSLMREPEEDDEVPRRLLRCLGELETSHLRILNALIQAPGAGFDADSPLATLIRRLPGMELAELQELVAELNDLRLTQIDNWAVITGQGSPDLSPYLTALGQQVARVAALSPSSIPLASPAAVARGSSSRRAELRMQYSESHVTKARHEYQLAVALRNVGTQDLERYRVDLEFPRGLLAEPENNARLVADRCTETLCFFRASEKNHASKMIHPGDVLTIMTLAYYVDDQTNPAALRAIARATLYIDGSLAEVVEKSISELNVF